MKKKIIYIDMDGVLANFKSGVGRVDHERDPPEMFKEGFFRNLPVMPGAKEAVAALMRMKHFDVYIATKPTTKTLFCPTEKFQWLQEHFPALVKKVFLVCDKGHLNGDYLIDDDFDQWGDRFKGEFLHFEESNPEECWKELVQFFKEEL